MHILKIIHGYPPHYNAGSEVYSQSICNELAQTHKVSVFTREENPYLPDFSIRKETIGLIDFYFVNMAYGKDGYRHPLLDQNFEILIQEIKPDIVHIGHLNHLSTGIVEIIKGFNIPIAFTLHDFWLMCPRGQFLQRNFDGINLHVLCHKQENSTCANTCYKMYHSGYENQKDFDHWTNWIEARMDETRSIVDKVDLFIAPSNYLKNRFIHDFQVPQEKIIYMDYGFPTAYLTPSKKNVINESFTFGYIGTHIPAKGVNLLIEAFIKLVQRTNTNAKLLIYGRENGQSTKILKQMANGYNIEFRGEYINKNLADEVFSKVDCIVVPSIWGENSPLVIHEAQACKIPVITADFGGMSEYVQHLVNGLLFEHRNVDSIAEQLEFAIENPEKMIELGKRGYLGNPLCEVPNIEDHCKELVKLYEKLKKK